MVSPPRAGCCWRRAAGRRRRCWSMAACSAMPPRSPPPPRPVSKSPPRRAVLWRRRAALSACRARRLSTSGWSRRGSRPPRKARRRGFSTRRAFSVSNGRASRKASMIRRYLSLWLPRLATDRARALLRRERGAVPPSAPLAVYAKIKNAQRLVCVDRVAASLGLTAGLPLADAKARRPNLVAVEADPIEEGRLLARIADWLQRFTPLVALDGADGIMLDIAGVAHLFGGEEALARDIETRLAGQGLAARAGIADFPRAAWALARFSKQPIAPVGIDGKSFAQLYHGLPLAALGLSESVAAEMARAGLRQIGDVAMRPRAPIAARFGEDVIARLDALSGLERGALSPRFAAPDFTAERRFASAIQERAAIEATLSKLAENLAALLQRQAKGARRLELALFRVDGAVRASSSARADRS